MSLLSAQREALCLVARSLHARGLTHGATGNISLRIDDGWLLTPTGTSLGALDPARLALLDASGRLMAGDPPTKETPMHLRMYWARPSSAAIVHLHAPHSVAVSILADVDPEDVLPPLTAYYAMRVGRLPLLPFYEPGDEALAQAVGNAAMEHAALLLANHGPIVAATSLSAAADAIEELEATARLFLLLRGLPIRPLTDEQATRLRKKFHP